MAYDAAIIADSVSEAGDRLTTMEVTFPRLVLAEFNTHRVFSRNSASSRAIPVAKQLRRLLDDPFVPEKFGRNQAGMQSYEWLEGVQHKEAKGIWLTGRDRAATTAFELLLGRQLSSEVFGYNPRREFASLDMLDAGFDQAIRLLDPKHKVEDLHETDVLNVHKQIANRVLEPYMWHTVIVTASDWSNFFALRAHEDAQAEIRTIAEKMLELHRTNEPRLIREGWWHLPLILPEEYDGKFEFSEEARKISAARCARVSYLTHAGIRDLAADITLYERLVGGGHMSPLEHPATPLFTRTWSTGSAASARVRLDVGVQSGNFRGWKQFRKFIPNEADFSLVRQN
jgi:hypothetical protein